MRIITNAVGHILLGIGLVFLVLALLLDEWMFGEKEEPDLTLIAPRQGYPGSR